MFMEKYPNKVYTEKKGQTNEYTLDDLLPNRFKL